MPVKTTVHGAMTLKAWRGDAKTLLAFDLADGAEANLAGFTIRVKPPGEAQAYYLINDLQFAAPGQHAQDPAEPAHSSLNAPFQKFRWLHVPGSAHQGLKPAFGRYAYTATPRYFEGGSLQPMDHRLDASVEVDVGPFTQGNVSLGFTRGFVQSQAYVNHFGLKAQISPAGSALDYDTSQVAGSNAAGVGYTYAQEYEWLGYTARQRIFALLDEVTADPGLTLDLFAYDLNEPDFVKALWALAPSGRVRIVLDNSSEHHNAAKPRREDLFATGFAAAAKGASAIKRGHFRRYAHDKIMIVSDANGPRTVLTGSTNYSITGLYVNANHVLVFDDRDIAKTYSAVFGAVWAADVQEAAWLKSPLSSQSAAFSGRAIPKLEITFAPHAAAFADQTLQGMVARIQAESGVKDRIGNVLFAVMDLQDTSPNPVYTALDNIHGDTGLFSYGISDAPDGVSLYRRGQKEGVLVTGKPGKTLLPPPFSQVPDIGFDHEIHHKFVVCGFNGPDAVVYCGSSNLAEGGEQENGDNLLAIHDQGIAVAFAIEAMALVDHYDFLDSLATKAAKPPPPTAPTPALKQQAAVSAGWFLSADDRWAQGYYDPADLHCLDRRLFGGEA